MTEFCLLSRRNETEPFTKSLSLRPVDPASFEGEVAALLSIPITALWIPEWRGDAVDDVLVKSRSAMLDGTRFEATDAYAMFLELGRVGSRVVCWYADYFRELPRVERPDEILDLVKTAIATEACELYLDAILDRSIT
jgi:hypothetical protein